LSYTVPGLIFIAGLIASLLTDAHSPILVRESILATTTLSGIFWFFHRKNFQRLEDHIFFIASVYMLMAAFVNGGTFLGETPIPRLKLYLKAIYLLCLAMLFVAFRMKASRALLVLLTAVLASNVFLQWFYLGITLRSIPLAAYLITSWFYVRPPAVRLDRADWMMLAICAAGLVSTLLAWNRVTATFGFIHLSLAAPFYFLARYYLPRHEIQSLLGASLVLFGTAIFFFAFFAFYTIRTGTDPMTERIAGYQVNEVGGYIALFIGIPLWGLLTQKNLAVRLGLGLVIVLTLLVLYVTSSRASMLAALMTIGAYAVMFPWAGWRITVGRRVLAAGVLACVCALSLWFLRDTEIMRQMLSSQTLTIRIAVWKMYLANTLAYAPVLGFGPESHLINASIPPALEDASVVEFLKNVIQDFGPLIHAHNLILQTLHSVGFIGIIPFVLLTVLILQQARRVLKKGDLESSWQLASLIALGGLFVQELFDYTLFNPMTYYPAMIFLGFAMRTDHPDAASQREEPGRLRTAVAAVISIVLLSVLSIIAWNRIIYVRHTALIHGEYTADVFANITFHANANFSPERVARFEKDNQMARLNILDHQIEQLSGEFYLELYRRGIRKEALPLAEKRYRNCLGLLPTSSFCASRIASILKHQGRNVEAEEMKRISVVNDPFSLNTGRLDF
jgi:hypothetical protein